MASQILTKNVDSGRLVVRSESKYFCTVSEAKEGRIKICNQYIRYVTVGRGPHYVICIPGVMGTVSTDFKPQVEQFDKQKFTLVSFDLPGFGESTPPQKTYLPNFHERDADLIYEFLKSLGVTKYSILGWCYGAIVGMIYAAKHPDEVTKLVVWGAGCRLLPQELETFKKLLDVNAWSPRMTQPRLNVYGEQSLLQHWRNYVNAISRQYVEKKGDFCSNFLEHIKCPTYILHGARDRLMSEEQVVYLKEHILDSRIYIYPEGNHDIHLRYADDFNKKIQSFLLES